MPTARNCSTAADMEAWYPPGISYNIDMLYTFTAYAFLKVTEIFTSHFIMLVY